MAAEINPFVRVVQQLSIIERTAFMLCLIYSWCWVDWGIFLPCGCCNRVCLCFLKSTRIVYCGSNFWLDHATGLFLRGAATREWKKQMPFSFKTAYTIAYMSVAGGCSWVLFIKKQKPLALYLSFAMVWPAACLPDFYKHLAFCNCITYTVLFRSLRTVCSWLGQYIVAGDPRWFNLCIRESPNPCLSVHNKRHLPVCNEWF